MVEAGAGGLKYRAALCGCDRSAPCCEHRHRPGRYRPLSRRLVLSGFDVLADLSGLRLDIANAGNAAVGATRGHARNKNQSAARFDHSGLGEMSAWLADFL